MVAGCVGRNYGPVAPVFRRCSGGRLLPRRGPRDMPVTGERSLRDNAGLEDRIRRAVAAVRWMEVVGPRASSDAPGSASEEAASSDRKALAVGRPLRRRTEVPTLTNGTGDVGGSS